MTRFLSALAVLATAGVVLSKAWMAIYRPELVKQQREQAHERKMKRQEVAGKVLGPVAKVGVSILAEAAAGLHAAHELRDENGGPRGVVHRDISPHNILLGTNGGCDAGHLSVDTVGVKITYRHSWVTPLANLVALGGTGTTLVQSNAMRMEPVL